MAKQPLTPAGVIAKQTELNDLSNTDLAAQAALITNDFKLWIGNNFTLNTAQATYLGAIGASFTKYAGFVTGYAVNARLPVLLVYPSPPTTWSSKFLIISDELKPKTDSVAGYSISGTLTFTVGYN
jgi:hypothetical protein